ncbi:MAG: SCO1664 family protein [Actinomycetota bacterium]|nr:SCO1664 family protein [Actinomycetota bacterium]
MNDDIRRRLLECPMEIQGRILSASNATLHCSLDEDLAAVYKPQRGERPLWDFPTGTLTGREVASFEIDRALGFGLIPPTAWREDGPAGPGMCQMWVDEDDDARLVDVVAPDAVPSEWIPVLRATDGIGNPVALVHADDERLQAMAVLDAILNNGDRKGGHVITDVDGNVWAVDHGVTLSVEPKLRTVLWGWAGTAIPTQLLTAVESLHGQLMDGAPEIERWLDRYEVDALIDRCASLIKYGTFPVPNEDWPAIPWPVF